MSAGRAHRVSLEDLRPSSLDGIVGQEPAIVRLRRIVDGVRAGRLVPPNLLFYGPPGVGKTTAARALGRQLLGDDWENSFHRLDASDDRSRARMLAEVLPLALARPSRTAPFRIFFFDEADALAPDVQSAMRPAMENSAGSTIFILACNDLEALSLPIRSRCTALEFRRLPEGSMAQVVREAAERIGTSVSEEEVRSIVSRSEGIPREAAKLVLEECLTRPGRGPTA